MNNDISQLAKDVAELKAWKEQKTRQQISFPLDTESINVLNKYFLRIVGSIYLVGGVAGRVFEYFRTVQDDKITNLAKDNSVPFVVDASTDVCTSYGKVWANDDRVTVFTSDTLPNPLSSATTYYIISASGFTFKLSLSSGGAAVNITDAGTGTHYIEYL